jgi:hypothetical protein
MSSYCLWVIGQRFLRTLQRFLTTSPSESQFVIVFIGVRDGVRQADFNLFVP